jgi:DNA invertase Pin-like site-specific DNA recombinase
MRAVTYSRFSTDRHNESSIADQERGCSEYAERQGWPIRERYSDQGISGRSAREPSGCPTLELWQQGRCNTGM